MFYYSNTEKACRLAPFKIPGNERVQISKAWLDCGYFPEPKKEENSSSEINLISSYKWVRVNSEFT